MKRLVTILILLLFAHSAYAGTLYFDLHGVNPGGKSAYLGTVELTEGSAAPDGSWNSAFVTWNVNGAAPVKGLALQMSATPTLMSVSFPNAPVPGVGIATVKRDGSVELLWYVGGATAGTELWTPKK